MAPRCLSASIFLLFLCCLVVLLLSNIRPWSPWNNRHKHLLSFISRRSSPFYFLSWIKEEKSVLSSSASQINPEKLSPKNYSANGVNESLPWIHFYASSSKILENYFFHGYYQGSDKYHKRFTHSRMAILPFVFDADDRLRKCINDVSLQQEMAVKHHTSMFGRWQWESSNEGLAGFKSKYKLFYGPASHGACLQTSARPPGYGVKINSKNGSTFHSLSDNKSSVRTHFLPDKQDGKQWIDGRDVSHCGQILLLQHPISRSIEEYRKTFLKQEFCGENLSFCKSFNSKSDSDINEEDNEDRLVNWIKNRGNIVFKHLLFHPQICKEDFFLKLKTQNESYAEAKEKNLTLVYNIVDNVKENVTSSGNMSDLDSSTNNHPTHVLESTNSRNYNDPSNNNESDCDKNVRLFLRSLDPIGRSFLVNYLVKNLVSLFSMVALYEDLEKSLEMLDIVHHFPLRECVLHSQKQDRRANSNSASSVKHNRHLASIENKVFQDKGNDIVHQDQAKNVYFETEILRLRQASESHEKTTQGQNVIFQDLKDDNQTERHAALSSPFANKEGPSRGSDKEDQSNQMEEMLVEKAGYVEGHGPLSKMSKMYSQTQISTGSHRLQICNEVSDSRKLFLRLSRNEIVQKSLDLDLKIYNEVKKIYQTQKKIVFNTLKT